MISLVTKSTHKKVKLNKKIIGKKLDKLASKVANIGIFVISFSKELGMYEIVEATTKRVALTYLPNKNLANALCVRLNQQKIHQKQIKDPNYFNNSQSQINNYIDLKNECMLYRHTMNTTKDDFKFESTRHRLIETVEKQKYALSQVKNLF